MVVAVILLEVKGHIYIWDATTAKRKGYLL